MRADNQSELDMKNCGITRFGQNLALSLGMKLCLGFAGLALLLGGCAHEQTWTPSYQPTAMANRGKIKVDGEWIRPKERSLEQIAQLDQNCVACHTGAVDPHDSMQGLSCVDCHGGDANATTEEAAHVQPRHPETWTGSANPEVSFARLNDEDPEFIRFMNPGDLRISSETCGSCHDDVNRNVGRSIMCTGSHFFGVAPYANGILPNKKSLFGESYSREGIPQVLLAMSHPTEEEAARSVLPYLLPLPHFEVTQTGNIFRVFERGSRLGHTGLGLNGLPVPLIGLPDKLEDPGRPNNRMSDRGLGTKNRIDLPLLNVFKTRLNDPFLSFLGTNDQPGDFRSSGCTACHMVYANDRNPVSSGPWAKFGNTGKGNVSTDPWGKPIEADESISQDESGHPIMHKFTKAIPTSQCMTCHHHQPNSFVNSYLGFTMWTYETDGGPMWPEEQTYPTHEEWYNVHKHNAEGAAVYGKWGDREFLAETAEHNDEMEHTQFADYHGHGWMFRAAFKMDRKGNLLDADGAIIDYDKPGKMKGVSPKLGSDPTVAEILAGILGPQEGSPVHLKDIHAERGMHCVDCHFEQDNHGDGKLYAEYQAAVEITCQDCHGSFEEAQAGLTGGDGRPDMSTSGPASGSTRDRDGVLTRGNNRHRLEDMETPWGDDRFFQDEEDGRWYQRSSLYPELTWPLVQVSEMIDPNDGDRYNEEAAYAKCQVSSDGGAAHGDGRMECYSCHNSWITACFGCHLPQKANWKTEQNHGEALTLRNYASYNPQAVRDASLMLGIAGDAKGNRIATVRSSSALTISSEDSTRQRIYGQVPTIAANGMSSQVFNTHFPHTVRTTETRKCDDCHVSDDGDNNAWLAQTYLLGTNYVNFIGFRAYIANGEGGIEGVQVTEWEEPQAVLGSELHALAYPDEFAKHQERGGLLGGELGERRVTHHGAPNARSIQLRGEYIYVANGEGGFRVYDGANIHNKGFSEPITTQPVSPLGQDTHVSTKFATAVALPTNNHISMSRKFRPENRETPYEYKGRTQNMHESYRYAYVSDSVEGLIVVDIDCLTDFDPQNNFIERVATFNPGGILNGAVNLEVAGTTAYICCDRGIVAVDINDPLEPRVLAEVASPSIVDPTAIRVQFRYAFVTDSEGLKVIDVTDPGEMKIVSGASLAIDDARGLYVSRTYAYVAGGAQGLVIVDVERPENPRLQQVYNADGKIGDLNSLVVGMTNDSLFAYLADGVNGMHVVKLVSPTDGGRSAYGFSPTPVPQWIASHEASGPVLAVSEGLDRDRAVDESGNQMAAFGRIGGRPMNSEEMKRLYLTEGELLAPSENVPEGWSPQWPREEEETSAKATTPKESALTSSR